MNPDVLLARLYRLMDAIFWGSADAHALLRWSVRHARAGGPLPGAWSACRSPVVMRDIVWTLDGHEKYYDDRLPRLLRCVGCAALGSDEAESCADCCRAVRMYKKDLTIGEVVSWARTTTR